MNDLEQQAHFTLLTIQKQLLDEHSSKYYQWLRHIITLSAGLLTGLVSLHNVYIPQNPTALWLLQGCWFFLFAAIALGQLALYGQIAAPFEAATRVQAALNKPPAEKLQAFLVAHFEGVSVTQSTIYRYAYHGTAISFVLSLLLLVSFVGVNLPTPQ